MKYDSIHSNFKKSGKIWGFVSAKIGSVFSLWPSRTPNQIRATKRKNSETDGDSDNNDLHPRKKLMTTSNYIYETLFEKGEGSDITVTALGQTWKLHLIYLKQSQYFDSYFGGRWPTPEDNCINLEIPDSHIDAMALHTVFGSLYCDEIKIPPNRAVNVSLFSWPVV